MRFLFIIFLWLVPSAGVCYAQQLFDNTIRPGDTRVDEYAGLLKGKRVALIINQTSQVGDSLLLDILISRKVNVKKIFVPEHGFRGRADAGAHIGNTVDSATGIPVLSLYGSHKKPAPEDLANIDVMVYDLQDVGVRFYTYISTLEYCTEACAQNGKQFIVLDRPNPNGFYVDGPVLDLEYESFVGRQQIPVVYGMTAGEYAKMLIGEGLINNAASADLKVIKCVNYNHAKKYELPVAPSPNLRTMSAVYAYPSLCLFEGTVVSVGRGTSLPFQQYGCPEFEGKYEYNFTPVSGPGAKTPPYEDRKCFGEIIGLTPDEMLQKIDDKFQIKWLIKAYNSYPNKDKFFNAFFTKLCGSPKLEAQIKEGDTEEVIRKSWQTDLIRFKKMRKKYLLYEDFE